MGKSRLSLLLFTVLLFSLLFRSSAQQLQETHRFPRYIWVFWEGELNIFTKICFNNMRHFAQLSGWEFTILNFQTFQSFLSKSSIDLFQKIKQKGGKDYHISRLADLVRLLIIYQKGGIWLDASTLLLDDLKWLEDIEAQQFFYNKISKQPQVIFFTYNIYFGGNKTVIYDEELEKEVYILPGMENWVIISKAKSKFLTDNVNLIRKNIIETNLSEQQIVDSYISQGYMYFQEQNPYFLFGNFNLQTTLQMKQKQIEKSPTEFTTKYAVDYYGMWLIRAEVTALKHQHFFRSFTFQKMLFYQHDKQQIKTTKIIKFIGPQRNEINTFIEIFPYLICLGLIDTLPKNSFLYQYMLSFDTNDSQIMAFKQMYQISDKVCADKWKMPKYYLIGFIVLIIVLGYVCNFLIGKIKRKQEYQHHFQALSENGSH